ncbi:transcriptional regulatory domain protein [Mycobacterium kansasii 662]|uniref:Transcriptional regulatory domain protein n=1 Tax=Mycobacterium kansasii 662 TaxID=1299326 RepID=X7XP90_MYCKA|nr:transcriptional regulatory domain protein [Mycobacterium kansasii 662]
MRQWALGFRDEANERAQSVTRHGLSNRERAYEAAAAHWQTYRNRLAEMISVSQLAMVNDDSAQYWSEIWRDTTLFHHRNGPSAPSRKGFAPTTTPSLVRRGDRGHVQPVLLPPAQRCPCQRTRRPGPAFVPWPTSTTGPIYGEEFTELANSARRIRSGLPSPTAGTRRCWRTPVARASTTTSPEPNLRWRMIATHYQIDFSEHYLAEYMATRGVAFLGWNTRFRGFESNFSARTTHWSTSASGVRWPARGQGRGNGDITG